MIFEGQVTTGVSVSNTVTTNEQEVVLPDASVATKVLVVTPTGKVLPEERPAVCATVTMPQLSLAPFSYSYIAPQTPLSVGSVTSFAKEAEFKLLLPLAREIKPPASPQLRFGASVSVTVTVKLHEAALPAASTARKVTVVVPTAKALPDTAPAIWVTLTPGQLSDPLAVNDATAAQRPASLARLIFAGQVTEGASASATFTVKEQAAVLPAASVAPKDTVLDPTAKRLPDAAPPVWATDTPGQLSAPVAAKDTAAPH